MTTEGAFRNRVMYDGLYTFGMRLLNMLGAAALGILTARLLGPAGKGLYALPAVEAGLIATAFGGLGSAMSYFLLNRRAGRHIIAPALVTASVYVAIGALAVIPVALFSRHSWTLLPAMLFLPASAAINLGTGYAVGIKRVRYSSTINVALTLLSLVIMAAGLFLIARQPGIAIAAWLIANFVIAACVLGAVLWHARKLEGDEHLTTGEFMKFGAKVGFVNLVSLLNYRADLYVVALLASAANLGMYTVAIAASESLLVPTQVAALVTSPHIGSFDIPGAVRLAARCVRNNLIIAVIVCGVLFAVAYPIVRLLYGAAFTPVVPALRILLLGVVALSLGSPMATYFTLKLGKPEIPLRLAGISAIICIALAIILVPRLAITGAAIASSVAYIISQVAALWYFTRTTRTALSAMLVPTRADISLYWTFLLRVAADSRRLLWPVAGR
jgi:O-antigen/teichoic acid export membrane protein